MATPRAKPPTSTKQIATHEEAHGHAPHGGLHYNKEELLKDYTSTFSMFMKTLMVGVAGAVIYFFGVIIYLGAYGHTHTDSYVKEFGSRIQYEYKGTKIPLYEDPSAGAAEPATGAAH